MTFIKLWISQYDWTFDWIYVYLFNLSDTWNMSLCTIGTHENNNQIYITILLQLSRKSAIKYIHSIWDILLKIKL